MRATAGRQAAAWPGRGLAWPFGVSSFRAGFLKVTGWAGLTCFHPPKEKKKGSLHHPSRLSARKRHTIPARRKKPDPKFQIELPTTPP